MQTVAEAPPTTAVTPWGTVACMSLTLFVLISSEFMPVSLLTPIARDLGIMEGQAGQAIAFSGFFAVVTSIFGNALLARFDRRPVMLGYTAVLVASGLAVTFAPNYLVFMFGRALIGIAIGGYISLTIAILARIVPAPDLPKAIGLLQSGSALATAVAAPIGSYLGGLVGWRGAFFVVVPIGVAVFLWQAVALPRLPSQGSGSVRELFALLRTRVFAVGMVALMLFFTGQFGLSTYLRPYLEFVTHLDVNALSLVLLALGLAGLAGTLTIGFVLRSHLVAVLLGFPVVLAAIALLLIVLGASPVPVTVLLTLWGLLTTPMPAAWNSWMTRVVPDQLEAGGALFVALIQVAIMVGAFSGGALYDHVGWWSPFVLGAAALASSSAAAVLVVTNLRTAGH